MLGRRCRRAARGVHHEHTTFGRGVDIDVIHADAGPGDAAWLRKIRPWWEHHDHFHVRLNCPRGAVGCVDPDPIPPGDGCKDAVWWVTEALLPPDPNAAKPKPKPPLQLADLPPQCTEVLTAR